MQKLISILILALLSCEQNQLKKEQQIQQPEDSIYHADPHSGYPGKDAFNWDWQRPTGKIALPASITRYITKDQEPIDTFTGDINEDNIRDLAVVTGILNEDSLRFENIDYPRHLLIFLGGKNNQYKFSFRNEKAIPCINCCGMTDPFGGMSLKKGQIIINEYCASNWKGVSEHRFRYDPASTEWLLDTVVTETYAFDHQYYELDTTTKKDFGRVSLKSFVMYKDEE